MTEKIKVVTICEVTTVEKAESLERFMRSTLGILNDQKFVPYPFTIQTVIEKDCQALIYCGPGHHSSTRCEIKTAHEGTETDPHFAHHPRTREELWWQGEEGMTDFFDNSPLDEP